jgi:putative sigma-54 modulation protein
MDVSTTARHFDLTPEIRDYGEQKLSRLSRYFDQIREGTITITKEKFRFMVEISLRVGGGPDLVSREETPDVFTAIDGAVNSLESQVRKHKGRLLDGREKAEKLGPALAEEAARQSEAEESDEIESGEWTGREGG